MSENSPFKRGIVRELDEQGVRAKVEFEDEDGVSSHWLSVNSALASGEGSRVYVMPELGSQVHCLVDWKGEDGTILGASFSKTDQRPANATDAKKIAMQLGGGLTLLYDKAAGTLAIETTAPLTLKVGGSTMQLTSAGATVTAAAITLDGPVDMPKGFSSGTGAEGSTPAIIKGKLHAEQDIRSERRVSAPEIVEG